MVDYDTCAGVVIALGFCCCNYVVCLCVVGYSYQCVIWSVAKCPCIHSGDVHVVITAGHSLMLSLLVGTNQGGVLAYSIEVPSSRHRESKSPFLMPVGKC